MPGGSPETRGASEGGEAARPPPGPGFPESGHREEMAVPRPTHYAAQRGPTERPWRQRLRGSRRPPQASLLCSVPSARRAPRTPTRKLPTSSLSFSGTLTSCPPTSSLAWCCCASGSGPNATRCWTRCAPGSPDRCPRPRLPPQPLPPRPCSPPRRPARPEVPPQLRARGGRRPLLRASRQAGLHSQTAPVLQANNDILAFLSGMPVTRNTKYLDLKNSVSHAAPSLSPSVPSREAGSPEPIPLPRSPGPGRAPARDLGSLPPCDPCSCEGTRAQPPLRAAWSRGAIPVCPAGPRTAPRVGLGRVKGQVPPACPAYSRIYSSCPTAISTRQDPPGRPLPPWGDGRAGREAARGRARTHGDALPRSAIRGGSRPALGRLRLPR